MLVTDNSFGLSAADAASLGASVDHPDVLAMNHAASQSHLAPHRPIGAAQSDRETLPAGSNMLGSALYAIPALVIAYLIFYFFFGERVPYNGGFGFDGAFYGRLAQNMQSMLNARIPAYYLDRILPSAIVWFAALATGIDLANPARVISGFHIYNSVLLVVAAFAWVRICRVMLFSIPVGIIGASALFLNWIVAKQYLYFVVQTDASAFALGVLAALCVVERRLYLLAVVAVVASFAFKAVMPAAVLLVLLPLPAPMMTATKWRVRLAGGVAVVAAGVTLYATVFSGFSLIAGADLVFTPTLPLSIPIVVAYVAWVAYHAPIERLILSVKYARLASLGPLAWFVAVWILRAIGLAALFYFFGTDQAVLEFRTFLLGTFATAAAKPGVFLVAHVISFGPAVLLLLAYLADVMRVAANRSMGAALFVLFMLAMLVNSESRIAAFGYPLMIVFLSQALEERQLGERRFAAVFVICSLLISRLYLPLNAMGMKDIAPDLPDIGALLRFPWQIFFMTIGPYMAWPGYCINLALTALSATVLFVSARRYRSVDIKPVPIGGYQESPAAS